MLSMPVNTGGLWFEPQGAQAVRLQTGSHFVSVRFLLSSLLRPVELGLIDMCRWYGYPLRKTPCQVESKYFSLFPSYENSRLKGGKEKEIQIKQVMSGNHARPCGQKAVHCSRPLISSAFGLFVNAISTFFLDSLKKGNTGKWNKEVSTRW